MSMFRSIVIFFRLSGVLLTGLTASAQVNPRPPDSSDQQSSPGQGLLARIKAKMADKLARLPNYTCPQAVERPHRDVHKKRFDRQDLVRLEVAGRMAGTVRAARCPAH